MAHEYSIDNKIPIPGKTYSKGVKENHKYPFLEMKKGDSFFVPVPEDHYEFKADVVNARIKLQGNVYSYSRYYKPAVFLVRAVEGGIRCWRVK